MVRHALPEVAETGAADFCASANNPILLPPPERQISSIKFIS
jgi:hypothetical protein